MSNDQTGYGYNPGGFAPTYDDSLRAQRNKHEMDRMSDFMAQIDPTIQRAIATAIRTQIKNGADPAEARRAAYGSAQGQMMTDVMTGLRRTGWMGQGDPIDYGANIMQGVAGGGFSMNVLDPGGRAAGMNQRVVGGGMIAGHVGMNLAKDLMTGVYGKDSTNPSRAYGFNMTETSSVFRSIAERGGLGNVGDHKFYGNEEESMSPDAVNEKIAIAKRTESNPMVKAALEGATAGNIDERIAKATKDGDKQVAEALSGIKTSQSSFLMNDSNTKRLEGHTKEILKGLANMKDIYGELEAPELQAKLEALTGIRVTGSSAEAKRANQMAQSLTNAAYASGNDPRAVADMLIRKNDYNQQLYGGMLGMDKAESQGLATPAAVKNLANAAMKRAMLTSSQSAAQRTVINSQMGTDITEESQAGVQADTEEQLAVFGTQHPEFLAMMAASTGTYKNNKEFVAKAQAIEEKMRTSRSPAEMAEASADASEAFQEVSGGQTTADYMKTNRFKDDVKNMDADKYADISGEVNSGGIETQVSDQITMKRNGGDQEGMETLSSVYKQKIGVGGMSKFLNAGNDGKDGKPKKDATSKSAEQIEAQLKSFITAGTMTEEDATAFRKTLNTDGTLDVGSFREQLNDVGKSARGGDQSRYAHEQGGIEARNQSVKQQRSKYSDKDGKLTLKSLGNALMSPDDGGLNTPEQLEFVREALAENGLLGDLKPSKKINTDDGYDVEEMEYIKERSGQGDKFDIHTQLGYDSQKEMVENSQVSDKRGSKEDKQRAITRAIEGVEGMTAAGTSDAMTYTNEEDSEKLREKGKRIKLAESYDMLNGRKPNDPITDAYKEIIETGKVSASQDLDLSEADGAVRYDQQEDTRGFWDKQFNDERKDTIHLKNAGKMQSFAKMANGKNFADAAEINAATGGQMLTQMETEIGGLKEQQGNGVKTIDTVNSSTGEKEKIALDGYLKELEAAAAKLKNDDGKGGKVENMTVTNLYVTNEKETKK